MSDLLGFSAEQATRLTRLSCRQLSYWDRTGFYPPRYATDERGRSFGRIYSFQDVVGLRILARLRNEHHIPLQELRRLSAWLKQRYDVPWANLRFYVAGRHILFEEPETGARMTLSPPGQVVFPFVISKVIQEIQAPVSVCTRGRRMTSDGLSATVTWSTTRRS